MRSCKAQARWASGFVVGEARAQKWPKSKWVSRFIVRILTEEFGCMGKGDSGPISGVGEKHPPSVFSEWVAAIVR